MRTRHIALALVLSLGLVGALAASASAECAMPRTFLSPATGASLPADPVLYVFSPQWHDEAPVISVHRIDTGEDEEVEAKVELVSESGAFRVHRVQVDLDEPSANIGLEVVGPYETLEARYLLNAGWKPTAARTVEITSQTHDSLMWTCSYQNSLNLELDAPTDAVAFRVEWASTEDDFKAGKRESVVLPTSMSTFFSRDESAAATKPVLELGHANCQGFTFRWADESDAAIAAGVVALLPDGTETPLTDAPTLLECSECQKTW